MFKERWDSFAWSEQAWAGPLVGAGFVWEEERHDEKVRFAW